MKLLAIDTSTAMATLAVAVGDTVWSREQPSLKTHAQCVLGLVDDLLKEADLALGQLDAIVFGCGPGSFTGLRIACSVAKGLAYAHDLPLIPVSTLGAIAYGVRTQSLYANAPVLAVLDARMQQMYWGYFPKNEHLALARVDAVQAIRIPTPVVLAGVGAELYWEDFPKDLTSQLLASITAYPQAAMMIKLAQHAGLQPIAAAAAQPLYVRNQVTHGLKEPCMDKRLLEIIVCPCCKGKLLLKNAELFCLFDRLAFPIREGIPVMLEHEARTVSLEEKDRL